MHDQHAIKFNGIQVSSLLDVLEKFGIEPIMSDAYASAMFSELIIKGVREFDSIQADAFRNAL